MLTENILFTIFRVSGIWRPASSNKKWKIILYNIYILFNITIYFIFVFSFFAHLLQVIENVDKFTQALFYFSTSFAILIKIISFAVKNKTLIELQMIFSDKICQPRDIYEMEILQEISRISRINTIIFQIMIHSCAAYLIFSSIATRGNVSLIFNTWLPYNVNESRLIFAFTYLYQAFALFMTAMGTISSECFVMLITLQIGGQLDIIVHRLNLLPSKQRENWPERDKYQLESKIIKDCVEHHNYVFAIGEKLNDLFGFVIFVQFFASMTGLCATIFQLSKMNTGSWIFLLYLGAVIFQIFIYSLYGEKLIEKSLAISHEIWHIEWINLANKTKKDLNMITMRASRPIKMTGSSVIIMSISTFVKVIKSAYSIYSLLANAS